MVSYLSQYAGVCINVGYKRRSVTLSECLFTGGIDSGDVDSGATTGVASDSEPATGIASGVSAVSPQALVLACSAGTCCK